MPRERRAYSGESPEERVAAALQTLEQGIDSILDGASFADYLRIAAKFHNYSFGNTLLIRAQRPDSTRVAGYTKWKELGRQVRKGEKGIKILVPYKSKIKPDSEDDETGVILRGFGIGTVFDISSTDGDPLPEPPLVQELRESSDAGAVLFNALHQYLEQEQVPVIRAHTKPANGYFDPARRLIALDYDLAGDQAAKTLTHETNHYVAGHTLSDSSRDVETVAESAAFVVLNYFGIDSSGYSFGYVAGWARDRVVFKRNLEAIQTTAHTVIAGLESLERVPQPTPVTEITRDAQTIFEQGSLW